MAWNGTPADVQVAALRDAPRYWIHHESADRAARDSHTQATAELYRRRERYRNLFNAYAHGIQRDWLFSDRLRWPVLKEPPTGSAELNYTATAMPRITRVDDAWRFEHGRWVGRGYAGTSDKETLVAITLIQDPALGDNEQRSELTLSILAPHEITGDIDPSDLGARVAERLALDQGSRATRHDPASQEQLRQGQGQSIRPEAFPTKRADATDLGRMA